jgi:integrase
LKTHLAALLRGMFRATERPMTNLIERPAGPPAEITLPRSVEEAVRSFQGKARAQSTKDGYRLFWNEFCTWCGRYGRQSLPASPETVAAWLVSLATGDGRQRPLKVASIEKARSAVLVAHQAAGHPLAQREPAIVMAMAGIRREKALTEEVRRAAPLQAADARSILAVSGDGPASLRDAALLLLMWGGALRESEAVGLDWQRRGSGTGYVLVEERGVQITLLRSKTSQGAATKIAIPRWDMPEAAGVIARWQEAAALSPGDPVFRGVNRHQQISGKRLTARAVDLIVKRKLCELFVRRGLSPHDAEALAARYSGHSLRAGFATDAALREAPVQKIQEHMRHRSPATTSVYIRPIEQWRSGTLKKAWQD